MRIAFQGVGGAYSDVAARRSFGRSASTVPCESFADVFDAVESGRTRYGVIPIENSLGGSIHENYDLLLSRRLHIVGETTLRIEHVLMALPGTRFRDLRFVRSHPQALAQCARFLTRHARLQAVPYFDTAGAARSVAREQARDTGAIASEDAARLYRLAILRRNVESRAHNTTRFLILGRTPVSPPNARHAKCSIAFSPAVNRVGILFRILGVFALRDINLLKIESRPDPRSPFSYLFYLDLEGTPRTASVRLALEHLQEMVTHYRFLGAYEAAPRR